MSKLQYLSPTSLSLFLKDKEEFYRQYLSTNKKQRDPQNQAMSIGSAFDAYAKSYLYESLFGKGHNPKYALKDLFESQVEEHNRTWAWTHGRYAFEQYKSSGVLADLMLELTKAQGSPRFEFSVMGTVNGYREGINGIIEGVPFLGKPDVSFITANGTHIILDWKVNGYLSNYSMSPVPGYVRMRRAGGVIYNAHKKSILHYHNGILINIADTLENFKEDWARQLAIYAWLLGEPIGTDFIVAVDQLVCTPSTGLPEIKVAEHRVQISEKYQHSLFSQALDSWDIINSDHFFRDMSLQDSQARTQILDNLSSIISDDPWLSTII